MGGRIRVPAHVTGFFVPMWSPDPLRTGSIGAGVVLEPGIVCEPRNGAGRLLINGATFRGPDFEDVTDRRTDYLIETELRLGAGYGLSASIALACSLTNSIAAASDPSEAFRKAHVIEVQNVTGLGDVLALHAGAGLVLRTKPGAPGIGESEVVDNRDDVVVLTSMLGEMSTREMLSRFADRIRDHGMTAFRRFVSDPTLERFLECSKEFSRGVGFLSDEVEAALRPIEDLMLGYSVKKRVLFVVTEPRHLEEVRAHLQRAFGNAVPLKLGDGRWLTYPRAIHVTSR
ncbi:MAG: pantothenate kinase [Nitrososphaerota archaeon]|nr:pantothenate kinase [Nitrososphaerota archaeon]